MGALAKGPFLLRGLIQRARFSTRPMKFSGNSWKFRVLSGRSSGILADIVPDRALDK